MELTIALAKAALLGAVTGLRSATGAAIVSRQMSDRRIFAGEGGPVAAALARTDVANVLSTMAVSELIIDKLPFTGSRTAPASLIWRALFGGLCGAAACAGRRDRIAVGALVGAGAAVAASYAGFHARRLLTADGSLPDITVALVEDAVAIGAGTVAAGLN